MLLHTLLHRRGRQPTLGLSLRGGGARAVVYLGFLRLLEEKGIKIGGIVGASGGALIGTPYAAGKSIEEITKYLHSFRVRQFVGKDLIRERRIISDDRAEEYIRGILGDMRIEQTPIPLAIQVTDADTGAGKFMTQGEIAPALFASCALPFVTRPVEIGGHRYIDGEIAGGYGVDFLRREFECDLVIGLKTSIPHGRNDNTPIGEGIKSFRFSVQKLQDFDQMVNPVDLLIEFPNVNMPLLDFKQMDKYVEYGYEYSKGLWPQLRRLLHSR